MKDKIKVALASLVVLAVLVVMVLTVTTQTVPPINPPEVRETEVVIALKSPTEGTIHAPSASTALKVLSQYYIPYDDERGDATSFNFFALDESEFSGTIYVFRQEPFQLLYEKANIRIIFPEGYDIIYQNMVGAFKESETLSEDSLNVHYTFEKPFVPSKQPVFEDGRWHYFISSDELYELARVEGFESIELLYAKASE